MPVPIPRREPAHHVLKPAPNKSDLQYLLHSIPDIPDGPPPAFSTRERWIDSLPPWRRDKLRHVNDERDDASISLPKFLSEGEFFDPPHMIHEMPPIDDPMALDSDVAFSNPSSHQTSRYPTNSHYDPLLARNVGHEPASSNHSRRSSSSSTRLSSVHDSSLQSFKGCHSTTDSQDKTFQVPRPDEKAQHEHVSHGQHVRNHTGQSAMAADSPSALSTVAPSASPSYAKSCEALAQWTAQYLWKVTTQGLSLPSTHVCSDTFVETFPTEPHKYLAESIHSVFLSTLIQPSVVILALQYISRLPVHLGLRRTTQGTVHEFRKLYIGDVISENRALGFSNATYASFKLFVIAVILSNKVLDDHVFTLKTWTEVSGISLDVLNKLEWLSLDLLSHELSLSPQEWGNWVHDLSRYHRSLAPFPLPIGAPKETPHNVVRCLFEDLLKAQSPAVAPGLLVEPVFLGIENRILEKDRERQELRDFDPVDFDLDEDGPLREEYIPKRRSSGSFSLPDNSKAERMLPPPAQWSPGAADSPVNVPTKASYQAVQRSPRSFEGIMSSFQHFLQPSPHYHSSIAEIDVKHHNAVSSHSFPASYHTYSGSYITSALRLSAPVNATSYFQSAFSAHEQYQAPWIRI
ncbi:hypothetical protein SISNIDRAFT_493055 [Sistotremastrum niveocremeum HHB9708]|uniref:Cyclin N-terminal domain-containing protein n=2 Tax=Sistotremastraceae TaxID=3402574 RepID=A0A164ZIL4_9AGAM|nr:hypothetical protein SISNIDRAFT_493055 [Sistotremastrum niveocremeum HHB9708]KZT41095.1 hypothetical protein SISSUDRAFT_1126668 [Sistotremastrum suecicum HHB10207 ss-3]